MDLHSIKATNQGKPANPSTLWTLVGLTVFSLICWDMPYVSWILSPIKILVTCVHELGHALVCLATGGTVSGLTIVPDNHGHGGLTFCRGGNPFFYSPAGYLGSAFFGCLLIAIGRAKQAARPILILMGLVIAYASIFLMPGTVFNQGEIFQGIGSVVWGVIIAAALIWSGVKLPNALAHLLVLFLAVQIALNAITDVWYLVQISTGLNPFASFSDATNMQDMTGIPALIWSLGWALLSVLMLAGTLKCCYGLKAKA
jgi:hypothetical protein